MNKIKNWFVGAGISIATALGIQVHRPPTIESKPPVVLATQRPLPITPKPIAVSTPTPTPAPLVLAKYPQLKIVTINGATESEKKLFTDAVSQANSEFKQECFKNKVLKAHFTETNGLDNQQIWDLLSSNVMSVTIEIYDGSWKENYVWKTMGYEDEGYPNTVFVNRFFVDTQTSEASLTTHEGEGHGQGFHHYDVFDTSIPYQFNDFIEACAP